MSGWYTSCMPKTLKITELGDPILRRKAKVVSNAKLRSKTFQSLIDNMVRTCDVKDGVGIAAPQVSHGDQMFILWSRSGKRYKNVPKLGPIAIINPKILSRSKKIIKDWEGCLSIPGIRGLVPRPDRVDVSFTTREGERIKAKVTGFVARIFQHEYDHLNGIVFLDRTDPRDLLTESEFKKLLKKKKK